MQDERMLKQAAVITSGSLFSRLLGLIYIFPFANLVGQAGQALYSYAYVPYVIFIDLATLGIPIGIAKFISIYNAQNEYGTSYRMFKKAMVILLGFGIAMFFIMFFSAKRIATQVLGGESELVNQAGQVVAVIRIIATALIIVPVIAGFRGFFQGFKEPKPAVLSQIYEQAARVSFIILSSFLIIKIWKKSYSLAVYFAVSGATLGAVAAFLVLRRYWKWLKTSIKPLLEKSENKTSKPAGQLIKELFQYALPNAFFGLITSLYLFIDTLTFNKGYLSRGEINPEIIYGTYAFEINKLVMIPVTFGIGLGVAIIIYLSEAYTLKYYKIINRQIDKALQACFFIVTPVIMVMMVFRHEAYSFFYDYQNPYGPRILLAYAPLAILLCLNHITCAALQGINQERILIITMITGISLKYLYNEPLITAYGYNGAILASLIGLAATIIGNYIVLKCAINYQHLFAVRRLLVITGLNIILGIVFYFGNNVLFNYTVNYASRLNCFLILLINTALYGICYLWLSYTLGLLDIILGRKCDLKKFCRDLRRKIVPNHY